MTGTSHKSEPDEYKAYSSIHVDVSLQYAFFRFLAPELNLDHESREIDAFIGEEEISLGSVEMLPFNLHLQFRFPLRGFIPYLGGGMNFTHFWEKSGELNRKKLSSSFGPSIQFGVMVRLSSYAIFNIDIKAMMQKTEFEGFDKEAITLYIDPIVFSLGFGFLF